ncbi:MAG: phosphomannomutase [Halobacteriales archaeon]
MFGTAGVRGSIEDIPPSLVLRIGRAVGTISDTAVVGRDGRYTGGALVSAFVAGASSAGCNVIRLGQVPTHLVAWTARDRDAYGVAVTASHNPPEDNGVKLFRPDGGEFDADDEELVSTLADEAEEAMWNNWTATDETSIRPPVSEYVDAVVRYVGADTDVNLRVAVDCANGVGAVTTVPVLKRLGCDAVAVNAQTDPAFPGRGSKPTPETLDGFADFVNRRGFDLGLAHDGDADRLVVVDSDGVVSEDAVLAVLARRRVEGTGTVLTTPNASPRVDEAVREAGGDVERVALGTVSEATRRRNAVFAAEPWKHVFPGFGLWVDGTVSAAEVVAAYSDDPDIFEGLRDANVRKESVACDDEKKDDVMNAVEEKLHERYDGEFDTADGVRVDLGDRDWFLVRPSGTEPYVRVYSEGDDELVASLVSLVEEEVRRA